MKQIVPFVKNIDFDTNVEEVTSISLDFNLDETKESIIRGVFELYLEYKENDISVTTLNYSSKIPFDIDVDDRYILDNVKVDIDDFYYEIEDNRVILHIDVLLDNLEEKIDEIIVKHSDRNDSFEEIEKTTTDELDDTIEKQEEKEDKRKIFSNEDNNIEIENSKIEDLFEEIKTENIPLESKKHIKPIFETFDPANETYVTYTVHIVREEDNIEKICEKYNVTKDELSNYNGVLEIKTGDKLIVPTYKK